MPKRERAAMFGGWLGLVALAVLAASPAWAHQVGLSAGNYTWTPGHLTIELTFAEAEALSLLSGLDADRDGRLSGVELEAARRPIEASLIPRLVVTAEGEPCAGKLEKVEPTEADGLIVSLAYGCPAKERVTVRLDFLEDLAPGHRQLVRADGGGSPIELVARADQKELTIAAGAASLVAPGGQSAFGMLAMGIEHILGGFDHLLFLLGLVIVGGKLRSIVLLVTAFTVAHSVTLGLAALGVFLPSPKLIEPAIALSVAFVAIENWFITDGAKRWRIALLFGLIHGFGFAGALAELRLPRSDVPLALLLFNLGVEAGQLAVLALVLPGVFWARRSTWFRQTGVRAVSAAVAAVALYWFAVRVWEGVSA